MLISWHWNSENDSLVVIFILFEHNEKVILTISYHARQLAYYCQFQRLPICYQELNFIINPKLQWQL